VLSSSAIQEPKTKLETKKLQNTHKDAILQYKSHRKWLTKVMKRRSGSRKFSMKANRRRSKSAAATAATTVEEKTEERRGPREVQSLRYNSNKTQ
jgi:hypothetical protein